MKLLKRLILFTLASEIDFFLKAEGFEYKPYKFLYERLANYKHSSIRDATLQLAETGEIDKIIKNGLSFFRLTARGRERLLSFFPISIGQKKVWDRIWRIAVISPVIANFNSRANRRLPPTSRLRRIRKSANTKELADKIRTLRHNLRKMGFKKLSRGVYLSPLPISKDIKEYLLKTDLFGLVTVIESRRLLIGDNAQLAWHIWGLEELVEKYNQVVKGIEKLLNNLKKQKKLSNQSKLQFSAILSDYFSLLETDPGLPKKLLPTDWPADFAHECFLKLVEKVKILESE